MGSITAAVFWEEQAITYARLFPPPLNFSKIKAIYGLRFKIYNPLEHKGVVVFC
jgi:hypothetical protein